METAVDALPACYTDKTSAAPGQTIRLHASADLNHAKHHGNHRRAEDGELDRHTATTIARERFKGHPRSHPTITQRVTL